jgi:hypothetical protein
MLSVLLAMGVEVVLDGDDANATNVPSESGSRPRARTDSGSPVWPVVLIGM